MAIHHIDRKPLLYKRDVVNSYLTYEGWALDAEAGDDDSVWLLKRTLKQGSITTEAWSDREEYNKRWDERNSAFDVGSPFYLLSTDFDGINDYLTFGNNYAYTPATAFSVSAWIKPQNFSAQRIIFGKVSNDANVYGWRVYLGTTGKVNTQTRAPAAALAAQEWPTALVADTWTHIAWVWTGSSNQSGQRLYINGVLEAFTPPLNAMPDWTHVYPFEIGRGPSAYYVGNIFHPAIWNKALVQDDIDEIYGAGSPPDLTTLAVAGNLVSWWKLGDGDTYPTVLDQKGVANGTMTNMTADDFEADVP